MKRHCFQYIDSLYDKDDQYGWTIYLKMVKNVKILWRAVSSKMDIHLKPDNIDSFETRYMSTEKQEDERDMRTFSLITHFFLLDGYHFFQFIHISVFSFCCV